MSRLPNIRTVLKRLRHRYFPERQLYFRANGVVRFVSFSPRVQIAVCLLGIMIAGWVTMTSISYLSRDQVLAARERQIEDMARAYEVLDSDMQRLQMDVKDTANRLRARQNYLREILDEQDGGDYDQTGPNGPQNGGEAGDAKDTVGDGSHVHEDGRSEGGASHDKPADNSLISFLKGLSGNAEQSEDPSSPSITTLEKELAALSEQQKKLANRLLALTQREMATMEQILEKTGLSKDNVLAVTRKRAARLAQGGPFVDEGGDILLSLNGPDGDDPLLSLYRERDDLVTLETIIMNMPVIKPVNDYYISSLFGRRSDPMTRRGAVHSGLDMAGWWDTPIMAGAAGLVTYSGWKGAYGKFIEVDHGNGFRTRYGHFKKLNVKKGQRVERGQVIGLMGSTGRSTGPHLHYEVWFSDTPLNPMNFFKAKDNVFKIKQQRSSLGAR